MTYREYRSFGHGALVAFMLSVNPLIWFAFWVAVGGIVGYLL